MARRRALRLPRAGYRMKTPESFPGRCEAHCQHERAGEWLRGLSAPPHAPRRAGQRPDRHRGRAAERPARASCLGAVSITEGTTGEGAETIRNHRADVVPSHAAGHPARKAAGACRGVACVWRLDGRDIDGGFGPATDWALSTTSPQLTGFWHTKMAVPGMRAPRRGLHPPQACWFSCGHSGSTRSARQSPAAMSSRTRSPRVR